MKPTPRRPKRPQPLADHVETILGQWRDQRPDIDPSPMGVVGRVKRLAKLFEAATSQNFARFDLEPWQFDVLASLRRAGAPFRLAAGALGRSMMITSGSVTNRVDSLERRGLVRRLRDPGDRRGVLIELTADGRRLVDEVLAHHLEVERGLIAGLPAPQREQLAGLLRAMLVTLEDQTYAPS
jgi:DNA-binding MarR family transcriptional regulator